MALDGWKERLYRRYLYWICRPARLKRRLSALVEEGRPAPPLQGRRLRAAALQVEIKLFKEPLDYAAEAHRRIREAAAAGAHLVAFPEDNNLSLLGMLPGVEAMGEAATGDKPAATPAAGAPEISVADVIRYAGPVMAPFLETLYSTLAAAYGLYIMAGSFLLPDGERVVNRSFLYGPDGGLIGRQDKVHLMPIEAEWGISAGKEFNLFETPAGRMAAPVCMDATYYETFRILELQAARRIIIAVSYTHLDVYKRQARDLAARSGMSRLRDQKCSGGEPAGVFIYGTGGDLRARGADSRRQRRSRRGCIAGGGGNRRSGDRPGRVAEAASRTSLARQQPHALPTLFPPRLPVHIPGAAEKFRFRKNEPLIVAVRNISTFPCSKNIFRTKDKVPSPNNILSPDGW